MKFTSILILLAVILLLSEVSDACGRRRGTKRSQPTNCLYLLYLIEQLYIYNYNFLDYVYKIMEDLCELKYKEVPKYYEFLIKCYKDILYVIILFIDNYCLIKTKFACVM